MTVCKMVAITNPLCYEQVLTKNRCYLILGGLWLIDALINAIMEHHVESWDAAACIYRTTHFEGKRLNRFLSRLNSLSNQVDNSLQ